MASTHTHTHTHTHTRTHAHTHTHTHARAQARTLTLAQDNIEYFEPYSEMLEAGTLSSASRACVLAFRTWRYAVETAPIIPRA
jgi:hypothetical protein